MRILHINGMTPPALAIAIALGEKGLAFEIDAHDWRDTAEALVPFADMPELTNGLEGEFPILVDGKARLSDSYFVLEYLDDLYPDPPLRPDNAYGQWQVQAFARFLGERVLPAVSSLGVAQRFASAAETEALADLGNAAVLTQERRDAWTQAADAARNPEIAVESARKLGLLFERIERMLRDDGGPWLLGADYTVSDIAAFALVWPFLTGELEAGPVPIGQTVRDWSGRVAARTAVAKATEFSTPAFLPGPEHARWG